MNVIEVNNLTKIYRLYNSPKDRLRELISFNGKKYHHEFYALKDVSFTVEKGQTVGIIGQNGSGKSTLLKIICGITRPTSGSVRVNGRISSLLELGAGFNPEFTGRENVYMNGALMGFSKEEMDRRFPEIEAFADIGEFMDQPVRTYSSGMFMRLAFSAAINVDPDILVIDEILAVGDENFQTKCRQKLHELKQKGKTILLVSHYLTLVEYICSKVDLLHHGMHILEGKPEDVIPVYRRILYGEDFIDHMTNEKQGDLLPADFKEIHVKDPDTFRRLGTKEVEIINVSFLNNEGKPVSNGLFDINEGFKARIQFIAHKKVNSPAFGIAIHHESGTLICGSNTRINNIDIPAIEGKGVIEYSIGVLSLLPGRYLFTAAVTGLDSLLIYDYWEKCKAFAVQNTETIKGRSGFIYLSEKWRILE